MLYQQLQQRIASGSACSTSGSSCAAAACSSSRWAPLRHTCRRSSHAPPHKASRSATYQRSRHLCRAAADDEEDALASAAELALDPRNDTVYDRMTFASTATPDYDDPQWVEKVDDWEAFWYGSEEDELALQLDEDMSPGERSEASLQRAEMLVSQLSDMRKRSDVAQMITGEYKRDLWYEDTYRTEDELVMDHQFYAPDPNPQYDAIDLRALSEKRAARAALDAEWKRREALLARPYSFTLSQRLGEDARLASAEFDWIREEWTEEQIQDLIIGSGKFVHPDKVKAKVLNPLLPMDFHNDVRVHVVPETEEFIKMIGHMATEEDIQYMQSASEIQLHAKDFVDTSVVFEDADGTTYVDAPPNPWADMQREEDARDLVLFTELVEKVTSKQRQREAAAAAAGEDGEEGGEYEAEEPADLDDDLMGEGFSSFVARDEDNEAGFLYYEDELDGDIPEASFLERDEAEEGEEGAAPGADS